MVDRLKEHWSEITPPTRFQIQTEIGHNIEVGTAGDKCDIDNWKEILAL
jgi:hypothetical protein